MFGLTGGICSGKSRVTAQICAETGWSSVSADAVAADLLGCQGAVLDQLRQLIGNRYFFPDGTLNRPSFRRVLFADNDLRKKVDRLLHPIIFISIQKKVGEILSLKGGRVVVEVPLLFEAGWQENFSEIIVVYAPSSLCKERLIKRDGVSASEADLALASQMPMEEKVRCADLVIDNSGTWADTLLQIKGFGKSTLAKSA